jgi:UDP-N-acetylmuramate dehydrogenase
VSVNAAAARLSEALSGAVRAQEPMARHTTYRIGGPAALFCTLEGVHEVASALRILAEEEVRWTIVGKGSNLLVADAGYDGAVLVLGREFRRHVVEGDLLRAGAASVVAHLVQDAFGRGLTGLSWAVGIPGSLGGALAMNAGTREGSVGAVVDSVTLFSLDRGLMLVRGSDVAWEYRRSGLAGRGIILEAALRVSAGDPVRVRSSMERLLKERKTSQPLGSPSAGSVFMNPEGGSAGRLIDEAGLKGARRGGALVSPVHANFIMNDGGATAADVMNLMRTIQTTVKAKTGVDLRPEIRFLGDFEGP